MRLSLKAHLLPKNSHQSKTFNKKAVKLKHETVSLHLNTACGSLCESGYGNVNLKHERKNGTWPKRPQSY